MPSQKRLKTAEDVRRYLANLILKTERKEIEPELASKLGYLINILLRAVEDSDVERRIISLEEKPNLANAVANCATSFAVYCVVLPKYLK